MDRQNGSDELASFEETACVQETFLAAGRQGSRQGWALPRQQTSIPYLIFGGVKSAPQLEVCHVLFFLLLKSVSSPGKGRVKMILSKLSGKQQ